MEGEPEAAARLLALLVQHVDRLAHECGVAPAVDAAEPEQLHVVPLDLVGDGDERGPHAHGVGLIVVRPVEQVVDARLGEKARGARRFPVILAEPAARHLSRRTRDRLDRLAR